MGVINTSAPVTDRDRLNFWFSYMNERTKAPCRLPHGTDCAFPSFRHYVARLPFVRIPWRGSNTLFQKAMEYFLSERNLDADLLRDENIFTAAMQTALQDIQKAKVDQTIDRIGDKELKASLLALREKDLILKLQNNHEDRASFAALKNLNPMNNLVVAYQKISAETKRELRGLRTKRIVGYLGLLAIASILCYMFPVRWILGLCAGFWLLALHGSENRGCLHALGLVMVTFLVLGALNLPNDFPSANTWQWVIWFVFAAIIAINFVREIRNHLYSSANWKSDMEQAVRRFLVFQ